MRTLHLISHTHWDREWYQTFQQFRLKLVHLVDGLLEILDTDPLYLHFMLDGQTIVVDDYLQIRPERETDLRKYIQNGRILIGPWYILPDEFLVSPEATIRNLLEGERDARRFGSKMQVGYIPDPFGHIGQMPQILHGFGIETACLWRGVGDQPNEFWWAAPDGTRVLMGFLQQGYSNAGGVLNSGVDGFVRDVRRLRDQLVTHTSGTDILLMNGTDHQEATPATSAAVAYASGKLDGDTLVHSTLPDYFKQVQDKMDLGNFPVVSGELRSCKNAPLLPGVLSARMWIKQRNQACETLLEKWVEPFSTWVQVNAVDHIPPEGLSDLQGVLRDPQGVLREAWRILMQCHPHDSICGCSIDQVHEEMRPRFDQVEQIGEEITAQSLQVLAGMVATQASGSLEPSTISSAVVVFNPSTATRSDLVSTELKVLPENGEFELVDEKGEPVPFQKVGMGSGVLYNMRMDRNAFRVAVEMISPGTGPEGMRFLEMKVTHENAQPQIDPPKDVQVELRVSSVGDPDLKAWNCSRQELAELLENPAIKNYHILVKGNPTSQVRIAARDVPGQGYRAYWVRGKARVEQKPAQMNPLVRALMPLVTRLAVNPAVQRLVQRFVPDPATRPPYKIENEFFTVEVQPDGSVDVLDKRNGVLCHGQNRFVDGGDRGDTYNYSKPEVDQPAAVRLKGVRVEHGTIQQTMELRLEMDVPEGLSVDRKARSPKKIPLVLTSRVTLSAGVERIEFHTTVDNSARDHRLRVHFAAACAASAVDYDGHFEIVRRALDLPAFDENWAEQPRPEVPQRAFTAISDGKSSLLVANRGLPEVEVLKRADGNSEVALTLLRCVGWLSRGDFPERKGPAGPIIETPAAQMIGHWSFDYALVPFVEAGRMQAIEQAYAFEVSLRAVSTTLHEGALPAQGSFIEVDSKEFIISAVKLSEDKRGMVVRGYNISGKPITVRLKAFFNFKSVKRVNLNEVQLESLIPSANNEIALVVKAYEIVTVLFTFME